MLINDRLTKNNRSYATQASAEKFLRSFDLLQNVQTFIMVKDGRHYPAAIANPNVPGMISLCHQGLLLVGHL